MEKDTLIWIVNEFRNTTRDLTIYEVRPQIEELKRNNDEIMVELRKATELAERLAADVKGTAELQRQLNDQARYIAELEKQVEDTEFKRGVLESECNTLATRYQALYETKQDIESRLFNLESPKSDGDSDSDSEESNDNEDDD